METERLLLRAFVAEDFEAIHKLRSDAEFMKYLRRDETRSESMEWIKNASSYWKFGIGFWAAVLKETNETIGWCGVWLQAEFEKDEMEIGYAIAKKHGGKGLATEAAKFALEYAFSLHGVDRIYALATPENAASQQVMKKLGMQKTGQQFISAYEKEMVCYKIAKENVQQKPY